MAKQLISAPLTSRLSTGQALTLTHCWAFILRDGLEVRATSHDRDVTVSLGGAVPSYVNGTYYARTGGTPKASRTSMEISGDSMTVDGLIDLTSFPHTGPLAADLRARRFAGAEFYHFGFDWENEDGIIPISTGVLGNITIKRGMYVAEVRRLVGHYLNEIGEPYLPECPHTLGGPRCGMRVFAKTHRLYGDMHPAWAATTDVVLREEMDEASNLKGVASLTPFTRVTTARPTAFTGRDFVCTATGTTGGSEPTWPTTVGNTVNDGTTQWRAVYARRWECRVTTVTDQRTLVVAAERHLTDAGAPALWLSETSHGITNTAQAGDAFYYDDDGPEAATRVLSSGGSFLTLAEPYRGTTHTSINNATLLYTTTSGVITIDAPDDWFGAGIAEFRTGNNRYSPIEIDTWDLGTATFTLQYGLPYDVQVGDQVVLHAGCRGRRVDCRDKWGTDTGVVLGNMHANGAHYDVPTKLVVFRDAQESAQ